MKRFNDLQDGIEHDSECEWASESCGCEQRVALRAEITILNMEIKRLRSAIGLISNDKSE